jgi:hypothetical protein
MITFISTRRLVPSALCVGVVFAGACNGSHAAPTSPSAVSFAGTWQGSSPASFLAGCILQLEISQLGDDVTGRWTLASSAGNQEIAGQITGRVIDSGMALVLSSEGSPCPMSLSGTLESDTRISGTYSTFSAVCPSGVSLPIVLEKR